MNVLKSKQEKMNIGDVKSDKCLLKSNLGTLFRLQVVMVLYEMSVSYQDHLIDKCSLASNVFMSSVLFISIQFM